MASAQVAVGVIRPLVVVALAAMLLLGVAAPPASAHETREVDRFTFTVGFLNEPAFAGMPNGVDLNIRDTESGEPFVDLTDTLDVDVTFGEETMTQTLRPAFRVDVFGTPGEYTTDFVPTRPGVYEFRFHGTVGDVEVDETFVSGPDTFNEVQSVSEAAFPVADPSTGELAERLDRELERLSERLDELEGHDMDATGDSAEDDESAPDAEPAAAVEASDGPARVLGIAALLLGVVAVGAAVARRKS